MSRSRVVLPALLATIAALLALVAPASASEGASVSASARASTSEPTVTTETVTVPRAGRSDRPVVKRSLHEDLRMPRGYIRKWPGDTIKYWAKLPADYQWSLKAAVAAWNRTGLDMTFKRVPKSDAKLKITIGDTQGADGLATVGYQAKNWVRLSNTLLDPIQTASDAYTRVVAAHIIAHELGHNLGLEHSGGCKLMTAVLFLPDCPMMDADTPGRYRCRVVDADSLDQVVDLYGGRRTQAPASCAVDKLPRQLDDVSFSGGLEEEGPVTIGWDPPGSTPSGTKVLVLKSPGQECRFPVQADFWGEAHYDPYEVTVKKLDPSLGTFVPPQSDTLTRCYGVQIVNRSGGGRAVQDRQMTNWVKAPDPPSVTSVRRFVAEYYDGYYKAVATWANANQELAMIARPTGQCVTEWPEGKNFSSAYVYAEPGEPVEVTAMTNGGDPIPEPCLSFFVVRGDEARASTAATYQVGDTEPLPALPVINDVTRSYDDIYSLDASYDYDVATLAYLVAPEDECIETWPGGVDPADHLADYQLDATGTTRPCFSFFAVNALGGVNPTAVTWQVAPAPTPPTPDISDVTPDGFGGYQGLTDIDPEVFGLAAVEAPAGECVSSFPVGEDPRASPWAVPLYDNGDGTITFYGYVNDGGSCLTFFAYNADGVVGPGVQHQL